MRTLAKDNDEYPPLLKEIPNAPEKLYVEGILKNNSPAIAIVGTRKPTSYGIETAIYFSKELSNLGISIVSGLAFGIDKVSHEACLNAGGHTVAVLASGVDIITPVSHERLGRRIVANGGAIISEFPPGTNAKPEQFPQRNRIISGISLGVIIIEAPEGSGALITAKFALEQNREVFVVPGQISSPNFSGSHKLIQEGAKLVTSPRDILEEFSIIPFAASAEKIRSESLPQETLEVLKAINASGSTPEELIASTGMSIRKINAHLTTLELKKYIRRENHKIFVTRNL